MTCRAQASPPSDFSQRADYVYMPVAVRPPSSPLWFDVGILLLSLSLIVGVIWALMLWSGGGAA